MFIDIIIGALVVGSITKMGIDKVCDVSKSIKEEGFLDTATKETKKAGKVISDSYKTQYKNIEKQMKKINKVRKEVEENDL